ncbi:MAG: HDOD domain-containing protein [Verrucomicrobiae bacterium]|nr:HDOD domain-containing protein [Verrucomicrobiae bacterium]
MPALKQRLEKAISVGHLPTIQGMLTDLEQFANDPHATVEQISEHISKDPSVSVRLLRIANSAYYARAEPVVDVQESVLFLGVAQIRIVAMTTRCVEAMCPEDQSGFVWTDFWRHCIATAHFCRMLGRSFTYPGFNPELNWMAGLLHDVGKLVIAMLAPDSFRKVITKATEEGISFQDAEHKYLDTDHGALGGWYLERQSLPPVVFEAVRCHHKWDMAVEKKELPAMANVADFLARQKGFGNSGNMELVMGPFTETPAWQFLVSNLALRGDPASLQLQLDEESTKIAELIENLLPNQKRVVVKRSAPADPSEPAKGSPPPPSSNPSSNLSVETTA